MDFTIPEPGHRVPEPTATADASVREFCVEVRCAPSTAWRLINAGKIDAYKVGSRVKIRRDSINALKDAGRLLPKVKSGVA
jgi:excisionase family DNA binding protein